MNCPNCGAPLRWRGPARVIECSYCQSHILTETQALTEEPSTTVGIKPKPLWPPLLIGSVVGLVCMGAAIAYLVGGGSGGERKLEVAKLRGVVMEQSADQFIATHGGVNRSGCVLRHVDDTSWNDINFCWEPATSPRVTSININPKRASEEPQLPPDALKRAKSVFGHQLVKQASGGWNYYSNDASFYLHQSVGISVQTDSKRAPRLDTLWRVFKHVVLGDPFKLGLAEQAALNVGYTLDGLETIDTRLSVRQAEAEVKRVYPGAEAVGARFDVGLEHPWFLKATIYWNNTSEGNFDSFILSFHTGEDFAPFQRRLESCITPVAGKPEVTVIDQLKDTKSYFWGSDGRPNVTVSHQSLVFRWNKDFDLKQHRAYLRAISGCKP